MLKTFNYLNSYKTASKLNNLQTLRVLFIWYATLLILFFIGRSIAFIYYIDRFEDADTNIWLSFLYGLRMDTITACALLLIPALILHLSPVAFAKYSNKILQGYFFIVILLAIFMENATLPFINEYDVRPNVIFINYLKYPEEVLSTVWVVYKLELFIAFLMMFIVGKWFISNSKNRFLPALKTPVTEHFLLR